MGPPPAREEAPPAAAGTGASWRGHALPVLALLAVAAALVGRLLFGGLAPYDPGFQARYRPWGAPASAAEAHPNIAALAPDPKRDPLDRHRLAFARDYAEDLSLFVWPDHLSLREAVRAGRLPLWQPRVLAGVPFLSASLESPWSPLNWPGYLLPLVSGRAVTIWLHAFVAGLGLYLFLIDRGRSRTAAFAGGAVYLCNPLFALYLAYGDFVPVFALVPLALVAIRHLFAAGSPRRPAAALAAITAGELIAGNLQMGLYALAVQAIAALMHARAAAPDRRLRCLLWVAGATTLGLLGASIQLLPTLEVAAASLRTPGKYAGSNSLPPLALLGWLFPRFFGHPANGDYVGGFLFFRHLSGVFGLALGTTALALGALAVIGGRGRRAAVALAVLVVALLALDVGPVHAAVAAVVPGFDGLHVLRLIVVAHLLQAILAADGLDTLAETPPGRRAVIVFPALLGAVALILEVGARVADGGRFWQHVRHLQAAGTLLLAPRVLGPLAIALAITALVVLVRRSTSAVQRRWAALGVAALAAVEALLLAMPSVPAGDPAALASSPEVVERLRAALGARPGRVVGLTEPDSFPPHLGDHFPPNTAAGAGFEDLRGFLRVPPAPMVELLATAAPLGALEYVTFRQPLGPLFDLLDVRYVLTTRALPAPRFRSLGPGLWENTTANGRAFFTRCTRVEPHPERRLAVLVDPAFVPRAHAVVDAPVPGVAACDDQAAFGVPANYPDDTTAALTVEAPAAGILVLADAFFPGWQVEVDGVPGQVLRVDHALRGVALPAGRHQVVFRFRPTWPVEGLALSLGAWLCMGLVAWGRRPRLSDDVVIGAIATGALALFAWEAPLPNDNDALYAGVMRTLREGGSWISLRIGDVPFLDKPPLFFWLGALVTAVLGESEFVLRLLPLAAGVLGVVLVARTTRRLTGSRPAAALAGLSLLAAPSYYEYARRVYMEVPVTVLGFWAFDLGLRERWKRAGLVGGLAFMLKSIPGGLGLGGLGAAQLIVAVRRRVRPPAGLFIAAGIAVAVLAPWHVLAYLAEPRTFLDFTVDLHLKHQIAEAQPWSTGGPLFYVDVLARTDTVIGILLAVGVALGVREFRRAPGFALGALLLQVALQFALYTVSATKKPFYLLTMYPFAAVLGARALAPLLAAERRRAVLAHALLAALFLLQAGSFLRPDPALEPSTYLAPLARRMGALAAPGEKLHVLDAYLASPQFYSRRQGVFVVPDEGLQRTLLRIPYLRYGQSVVAWSPTILRDGGWLIAPAPRAEAIVRALPGVELVARNEGFWLLRGPGGGR